jgi:hypothetical protein
MRRLSNEAETRSELRNDELTVPRLHVHFEAAGGSKAAMGLPAFYNRKLWTLVAVYLFAIVVSGFLYSVLSVIFVIEAVITNEGIPEPVPIPLGVDIPEVWDGEVVDPCTIQISAPGCAYDLALTTLSSHLVTYAPYTVGGVTFTPDIGTLGLPYWALKHFSDHVKASNPVFEEERRQYCLPVLEPHIIKCHEEPFINDGLITETNSSLLRYKSLHVTESIGSESDQSAVVEGAYMYKIILDYPSENEWNFKYRTNDEGQGTLNRSMVIWMFETPAHLFTHYSRHHAPEDAP